MYPQFAQTYSAKMHPVIGLDILRLFHDTQYLSQYFEISSKALHTVEWNRLWCSL